MKNEGTPPQRGSDSFALSTRFSKHMEHIFLICFHTRLVERVDSGHIGGKTAGHFKEAYQRSKTFLIDGRNMDLDVGNTAGNMSRFDCIGSDGAYFTKVLAGKIVQPVCIAHFKGDGEIGTEFIKTDDGLHQITGPVLNELTHGMKIGGKLHGSREDADSVLAFRLTVQLLPPFRHKTEAGFVTAEDLCFLAETIQVLTGSSVLPCRVLGRTDIESLELLNGRVDYLFDVDAGNCHGKKTHCGKNTEASAHIVGDHESLPAFRIGQGFQNAACGIRCGNDVFLGLITVFLLAESAENTECDGRFQCRAGFGNDIDVKIIVTDLLDGAVQRIGR